jgi:hypothetical protein
MKGVNKNIETYLDRHAKGIIDEMKEEFDSHDFIKELIKSPEGKAEYTRWLHDKVNKQIGLYLAQATGLDIKETGLTVSTNNFGNKTQNHTWEKT